ncbi:MAG: hypothetical protein NVSMB19_25370 [Vulcanimicrobiaceae bacterium]
MNSTQEDEMAAHEAAQQRVIAENTADLLMELLDGGWPQPLVRAVTTEADYALGLRDGTIMHFHRAELVGSATVFEFVRLTRSEERGGTEKFVSTTPHVPFDVGVYVRVNEIAWIAENVFGA